MFFKMYAMQMVSWGVYDVINYLSRSFFYGLCALVKLLLGLSWIEKGGLFLNVALFMGPQYTESVDGKQRKGFYVVIKLQWWTLHRDGHIFVRTFSVGLKIFCYGFGAGLGGGGSRGERDQRHESNGNCYNSLLKIKIVVNAYRRS